MRLALFMLLFYPILCFSQQDSRMYKKCQREIIRCSKDPSCTTLDFRNYHLTSLPPELWDIQRLVDLDLRCNLLTSLPSEITQLTQLRYLDLGGNLFDSFPLEVCGLSNLRYLSLNDCQFCTWQKGYEIYSYFTRKNEIELLPVEIGKLSKLHTLYLQHNQLTSLPAELGEIQSLKNLHVDYNLLTSLPVELTFLNRLERLTAKDNPFEFIPDEFGVLGDITKDYWGNGNYVAKTLQQLKYQNFPDDLKRDWELNGIDNIEGIYEGLDDPRYTLALIKTSSGYNLQYISGAAATYQKYWVIGDIKAVLTKTATPFIFKANYVMGDKSSRDDVYVGFENSTMKVIFSHMPESNYIKLYPTYDDEVRNNVFLSGTGFALSRNGYIATNYHVIEGHSAITVRGVQGDFTKSFEAELVAKDVNNDLAILRINDLGFTSLGNLPYKLSTMTTDIGASVFTLGYPLRSTMGDDVKLTNGIISSKTGYQGDVTSYQSTVPVQPGNSGGPMFDSDGNIVGIVNAKHAEAENASYAIKTSYLMNLIDVLDSGPTLNQYNSISNKSLSEQVKALKNFVYIIEVE